MELADETPLVNIPPEAYPKAEAMRALLNADLEEAEIAKQVMAFELGEFEVQMGAWTLLTWKEQMAWREYRQLARRPRG